jgi:septal ring factor EnvC (AmiA/AmiB activator)
MLESIDQRQYKDSLFVYGTEIHDFLSVDYDAISMLNVSATQELAKQLKEAQSKLQQMETENAQVKSENAQLKSSAREQGEMMRSMKAQIDAINDKLNITTSK